MWTRLPRFRLAAAAPAATLLAIPSCPRGSADQDGARRANPLHRFPKCYTAFAARCDGCSCGAAGGNIDYSLVVGERKVDRNPWLKPAPLPQAAVDAWRAILGPDRFFIDKSSCDDYADTNAAGSYFPCPPSPQAVAQPKDTDEVSRVLWIANEHRIPVVTYGGGTSLEGNVLFNRGGLCLDLCNLDKVLEVHDEDAEVTLQAAVGWQGLNESLEPARMMLGVDPGPGARVGGMVSTNCSGPHAFRWGMMRQHVVNVTAVLADGTVIKTRQRPRKTSAGYDLTGLITGSEGTLAVVTEATLRLQRIPAVVEVARVGFPSVRAAFEAVREIKRAGLGGLLCCEFLCAQCVRCVNYYSSTSLPEEPMLLLKFGANSREIAEAEIEMARACCLRHTKAEFEFSRTPEERETLWEARKGAGWAIAAYSPKKKLSVTDTAVPMSRVGEYIERLEQEFHSSWLEKAAGPNSIIAHIGDGNVHCSFPFDPEDDDQLLEARRLNAAIVKIALQMEGTCTGEHGVGVGKRAYLLEELGPSTVETMWSIKQALDPNNILNPGKVLPDL